MKRSGSNSSKGRRSRAERSLSQDLEKRLASYAAAASAAGMGSLSRIPEVAEVIAAGALGVGLLLTAAPASSVIVYTPAYSVFSLGFHPLDLNHDGIVDFNLFARYRTSSVTAKVIPYQAGNAILGKIQGVLSNYGRPVACHVASALPAGHPIGPGSKFGAYETMGKDVGDFPSTGPFYRLRCGYWLSAQGRFLGLVFTVQGQQHFGWARLNVRGAGVTLTGYAYETEANKPIRAGDTGPVANARRPEMQSARATLAALRPATLGLLALGSAGLDVWRKEETVLAA